MRWFNPLISKKNNKYGFITIDEKIIHPFVFDTISYIKNKTWYNNYYFLEAQKNNKKGILDNGGRILLDLEYDKLEWINLFISKMDRDDDRGLDNSKTFNIIVTKKHKSGLIDAQLNQILPMEFDDIRIDGKLTTSPIIARKNNYSIIFDSKGSFRFKVQCDSLKENLKLDYFEIYKNGRQGILDYEGNLIFNFDFTNVRKIEIENLFIVKKDSSEYIVDANGKILSDGFKEIKTFRYDWNNYTQQTKAYYLITKTHDDKVGLLDQKLNIMIPNEYDAIEDIFDLKYVHALKNGKYGILDLNNNIVIPFKYTERISYNEGRKYFDCDLNNENLRITPQNVILKEEKKN